MQLGRYEQAEGELRKILSDDPDHALALAWLGVCRSKQEDHEEATRLAERATGLMPDEPYGYLVLGQIYLARNRLGEAERSVVRSIELEPHDADAFSLLASIHATKKSWKSALEAADQGLEIDPEDETCTNLRALALTKLGREDEAADTMRGALERAPESAVAHANQGWTLLHQGRHEDAITHFREALRLEPDQEWAREGMKEALKARSPLFRLFLRYKLWMSRLRARWQFAIIIGAWVLYRFVLSLAERDVPYAWLLWIPLCLWIAFAVLTWLADPIFNFFLWLNPVGKWTLTKNERRASIVIGSLLLTAAALAIYGWSADSDLWLIAGLWTGLLCYPLNLLFELEDPRAQRGMLAYTAVVVLVGAWHLSLTHQARGDLERLRPALERAQAFESERLELLDRKDAIDRTPQGDRSDEQIRELAEIGRRAAELPAEKREIEMDLDRSGYQEFTAGVERRDQLVILYAVLCAFVSQFVAVSLARWAARK